MIELRLGFTVAEAAVEVSTVVSVTYGLKSMQFLKSNNPRLGYM